MTPEQITLVQISFQTVVPIAGTAADLFYDRLGERHKGYGVTAEQQYAPVGAALLWTLEQGLGPDFTPETKTAWTEAYTALAGVMSNG